MWIDFSDQDYLERSVQNNLNPFHRSVFDFLESLSSGQDLVVKTSGSTGLPKSIVITQHDAELSARISNNYFNVIESSRFCLCLPIDFIAAKMLLLRAKLAGASVFLCQPKLNFYLDIDDLEFDFVSLTTLHVHEILNHAPWCFSQFRNILIGGGSISKALEEKLKDYMGKAQFYESFGMTETVSHFAIRHLNSGHSYFEVLDQFQVSTDSESHLIVSHPIILRHGLKTNDAIECIDSRHFRYLGRMDHVINSSGLKIYPEDLELMLSQIVPLPFIIAGLEDVVLGQKLVMVLKERIDENMIKEIWSQIVQLDLPSAKIPKEIYHSKSWKETENFKPMRNVIKENIDLLGVKPNVPDSSASKNSIHG